MFNPYQNNLLQQKALIEQQLQQMNVPPININNQFTQPQQNYDFNGKWVSSEQEAKQTMNNNLPLIMFDKDNPVFYMKSSDGTLKKYTFQEAENENYLENKVSKLDDKLNKLLEALGEENEPVKKSDEQ